MHEFPRDPNSSFNHITRSAIRSAVVALAEGVIGQTQDAQSRDFHLMLKEQGGWNAIEVLKIGAVCAFMKGLDETDYNAALVKQALADYGWIPLDANSPKM